VCGSARTQESNRHGDDRSSCTHQARAVWSLAGTIMRQIARIRNRLVPTLASSRATIAWRSDSAATSTLQPALCFPAENHSAISALEISLRSDLASLATDGTQPGPSGHGSAQNSRLTVCQACSSEMSRLV
jgi:hypothetical protein